MFSIPEVSTLFHPEDSPYSLQPFILFTPPSHRIRQLDSESPKTKAEHICKSSDLSTSQKDLDAYLLIKFFCMQTLIQFRDQILEPKGQDRGVEQVLENQRAGEEEATGLFQGRHSLSPTPGRYVEVYLAPRRPSRCQLGRAILGQHLICHYRTRLGQSPKTLPRPHPIYNNSR